MIPRLIAERTVHGDWECRTEGDTGLVATAGKPVHALAQLCMLLGLSPRHYTVTEQAPDRVVYVRREDKVFDDPCPDCGGSGRYIGLNVVEDCPRCDGSGRVPW